MAITLKKWCMKYATIVATRGVQASTQREKILLAGQLCAEIGDRKLTKIRPMHIASALRVVWGAGYPAKARRMLSAARDVFGEAVVNGYLDNNPASPVKPLPCRVRRTRLSLEQWQRVQTLLEREIIPWRRVFCLLALVSGQRRSDLIRMRFTDIWDSHLHVIQYKTGERIALPLSLRLKAIGVSLREIVTQCRTVGTSGDTLLRKTTGQPLSCASLTRTFTGAFHAACGWVRSDRAPPSLQEIRSLAARLYNAQGVDTQTLLGHRKPATTALYHDDRGLDRESGVWRVLHL
jgi:integrase